MVTGIRTRMLSMSRSVIFVFIFALVHSVVSEFLSYGDPFPENALDRVASRLQSANGTTLTICQLWENDSIPVTPGIEIALEKMKPYFDSLNITFKTLISSIPAECTDETVLAAAPELVDMHLRKSPSGCALLVGPSCTESMYGVRSLVMRWNIPVITSGASGIKYDDKAKTPVLTRFGYTQEDVSNFLIRILERFNWTNHALIYDDTGYARDFQSSYTTTLKTRRMELYQKLEPLQFFSDFKDDGRNMKFLADILLRAGERCRIFVISALPRVVYEVLLTADKIGLLTPEYVFITTNLIETRKHGFSDLSFFDEILERDPRAARILDSLLVIRMRRPADVPDGRQEYEEFAENVRRRSRSYGYVYGPGEEVEFSTRILVTHLVLGIWDAVILYGLALNRTLMSGGDIRDGRELTKNIWGHSFRGVALECTISNDGDRNFPYYLLDLGETKFRPALLLDTERQAIVQQQHIIHWPGDLTEPPPNEPFCGFDGQKPHCLNKVPAHVIALIVIGCVLLLMICVGGFVAHRNRVAIVNDSWRIRAHEITSTQRMREMVLEDMKHDDSSGTGPARIGSVLSRGNSGATCMAYIETAFYRETVVAVKKPETKPANMTPALSAELRNLKSLMSDNIVRFYGICSEGDSFCIVTEYCQKGSLHDLIENDSIKLDWAFKFSLLNDIVSGLVHIHRSYFKSHGRLTSTNCLIDSRFIVKIGDLGLTAMRPSGQALDGPSRWQALPREILYSLLWRAPELLRTPMPWNGTPKGDIYSFGIILQELIERAAPFEHYPGSNQILLGVIGILDKVRYMQIPPFRPLVPFDACPVEIYSIMLRCWAEEPEERPDIDKLRTSLSNVPGNKSVNLMDGLIQRLERYANDLELLVSERTSAFMEEKRRSEELLYQMLPKSVADKLKQGLFCAPESFDAVTIYFSDICGFTTICSMASPMDVVALLNDLYTLFDSIIELYDIYKVETIGDAYVVVSGLPQRNGNRHAAEISRFALNVVRSIQGFQIRHKPEQQLAVRVGIHTGPCASGVVGHKMPRFCIFGDSVNVASRLESTGQAMKIQISRATKSYLEGNKKFVVEYGGEVDLKGRGTMATYWLLPGVDD